MSDHYRSPRELWVHDLGTVGYGTALDLQEELRSARQAGELPDFARLEAHVRDTEAAVRASFGRVLGKVGGKTR